MKVSLLNEKILIQKSSVVVDAIGNRSNKWEDYFSCFATVGGEGNMEHEKQSAGQTWDSPNISFTIRYCSKIASLTSTNYRVLFRGEIYNIHSIDHKNFKKRSIKLNCKKVRR